MGEGGGRDGRAGGGGVGTGGADGGSSGGDGPLDERDGGGGGTYFERMFCIPKKNVSNTSPASMETAKSFFAHISVAGLANIYSTHFDGTRRSKSMSSEKRQRASERAARTRARRVHLKGPQTRRGPKDVENERIERGRRTLTEAFGEIPSQAEFLRVADLFEFRADSDAVDRAFIVPDGLQSLTDGASATLYWYKRNAEVSFAKGDEVQVATKEGERFVVIAEQHVASEMTVRLKKKTYVRRCTGAVSCRVIKKNE